MKILILHSYYPTEDQPGIIGGAEVSVQLIAEKISANCGHDVSVIRAAPPGSAFFLEKIGKITVYHLPVFRPYWLFDGKKRGRIEKLVWHTIDGLGFAPRHFRRALKEVAPDIVFSNNIQSLGWRCLKQIKQHKIPVIQYIHDYYFTCSQENRFKRGKRCQGSCLPCRILTAPRKRAARYMDTLVSVSARTAAIQMANGFGGLAGRRLVIPNGFEPKSIEVTRDWEGLRFGFLGRIVPEKGLELAADCIGRLDGKARLQVAGKGDQQTIDRLKALAKGKLDYHGFVEPDRFFRQIDVLVAPSLWDEPFGRISVEAQAYGIPCIVSDRGGLPETIAYGKSGWIFEPDNKDELFNLMSELIASPEKIRPKASQAQNVALGFSIDRQLPEYKSLAKRITP